LEAASLAGLHFRYWGSLVFAFDNPDHPIRYLKAPITSPVHYLTSLDIRVLDHNRYTYAVLCFDQS
jgi:hypothetical protein